MVSGVSWAFFFLQADAVGAGNGALGLDKEWSGGKPYAAAAAYHPFANPLLAWLRERGLAALYQRDVQRRPGTVLRTGARAFFDSNVVAEQTGTLGLNRANVFVSRAMGVPATEESIDFSGLSPYGSYNYELLFHAPILAASQLLSAGRHDEAQRFFHFVFNPLEPVDPAALGRPWWITAAFDSQTEALKSLEQILRQGLTATRPFASVESNPFDAHAVATSRPGAYQRFTVLEYVRNLLEWGDALYRRAKPEDLDEAWQLYALAGRILGERPLEIDPLGVRPTLAFENPAAWGGGANVLVNIENLIPDLEPDGPQVQPAPVVTLPLRRVIGQRLYFGVPRNDRLLSSWDRLERAVTNLRTCKSLDGATLDAGAMLSGDIDLDALVSAAAAGSGALQQALSLTAKNEGRARFTVLASRALEFASETRNLGGAVLSASERRDAEELSALRLKWDGNLFTRQRQVRAAQVTAAQRELDALVASRALAQGRFDFFEKRERRSETERAAFTLSVGGAVAAGGSSVLDLAAAPAKSIPNITIGVSGMAASPVSTVTIGGESIGGGIQAFSRATASIGALLDRASSMTATEAGYERRAEDWNHARDQAALELKQLEAQKTAATVRLSTAKAELAALEQQRADLDAQVEFLESRFSKQALYDWLVNELGRLHRQSFELAWKMAQQAADAFAFELPAASRPDFSSAKWDPARRGLTAAEELSHVVRQMIADHLQLSAPQRVVTRRFSLQQLAPSKLNALRSGADVDFDVPAWWLRRLDPGLRNKRVRLVTVTLPAIGGSSASVNATLSSGTTSVTLSTGIDDAGCDLSVRGERYLPFEGLSMDGGLQFRFSLPRHTEIDRSSIADVVLRVEFLADEGVPAGGSGNVTSERELDISRDEPDVWRELGLTGKTRIDLSRFTPSLLADFTVQGTPKVVDAAGQPRGELSASLNGSVLELSLTGALAGGVARLQWSLGGINA